MSASFNQAGGFRKTAAAVAAILFVAAGAAYAQDGVVVASSSPRYGVGHVFEAGQVVELEPGATVSIMEESGRVVIMRRSGPFRAAAQARPAREGPSLIASIAALMTPDHRRRAPGSIRTADTSPECEAAADSRPDLASLDAAIAAHCPAGAARILTHLANQAGPPELFARLVRSRDAHGRVIGLQVQANFDAYLYCRLRRDDASIMAITPEPAALPMRVVASSPYDVMFPTLVGEGRGAVQCMAVSDGGSEPSMGDWPDVFDPERLSRDARVATAALNLRAP